MERLRKQGKVGLGVIVKVEVGRGYGGRSVCGCVEWVSVGGFIIIMISIIISFSKAFIHVFGVLMYFMINSRWFGCKVYKRHPLVIPFTLQF